MTGRYALARFEGAGYHADEDEALMRALEAVREQVAENIVFQLSRNWDELARADGPIEVVLLDVTSLIQVRAVRSALEASLGAKETALLELRPGSAWLRVVARLSPGALQERLTSVVFDGFQLETVEVEPERLSLRIRPEEIVLEAPAGVN